MYPTLRLHVYACPPQVEAGPTRKIAGYNVETFKSIDLSTMQLPVSFEQAAEQLERFERLHFEYDGSFVWSGVSDGSWQLDGMLYDYGGRLQRVELQGCCPLMEWRKLLSAFAPSNQLLLVHWLDEQCFVSVETLEQRWSRRDV